MKVWLGLVLALGCAAVVAAALSLSACQKLDDAFGEKVHAYLMAHPEVVREAAMKLAEKTSPPR